MNLRPLVTKAMMGNRMHAIARLALCVTIAQAVCTNAQSAAADAAPHDYCLVCHGAYGQGNHAIGAPQIAGMPGWYLRRQLEGFRSGARGAHAEDSNGVTMRPMATALADEDTMRRVIDTVAAMPSQSVQPTLDGDRARGATLYLACAACHGNAAAGIAALATPPLRALNDWYMVTQLTNYRAGHRGYTANDIFGAQMRAASALLNSEEDIRAVVTYISSMEASTNAGQNTATAHQQK